MRNLLTFTSVALSLIVALPIHAKSFQVTTNNDSGPGSLRTAIIDANTESGYDTISISVGGSIILETNPCPSGINILGIITDSLCIIGNGIEIQTEVSGRFFQNDDFLKVEDISFVGASAVLNAGAIWCGADAIFYRCSFESNNAPGSGGAIRNTGGENIIFEDCTFKSNLAGNDGGAINLRQNAQLELRGCRFEGNIAIGSGNAIYIDQSSLILKDDCQFVDVLPPLQEIIANNSVITLPLSFSVPIGGIMVFTITP